jgi:hypothetical protein
MHARRYIVERLRSWYTKDTEIDEREKKKKESSTWNINLEPWIHKPRKWKYWRSKAYDNARQIASVLASRRSCWLPNWKSAGGRREGIRRQDRRNNQPSSSRQAKEEYSLLCLSEFRGTHTHTHLHYPAELELETGPPTSKEYTCVGVGWGSARYLSASLLAYQERDTDTPSWEPADIGKRNRIGGRTEPSRSSSSCAQVPRRAFDRPQLLPSSCMWWQVTLE